MASIYENKSKSMKHTKDQRRKWKLERSRKHARRLGLKQEHMTKSMCAMLINSPMGGMRGTKLS